MPIKKASRKGYLAERYLMNYVVVPGVVISVIGLKSESPSAHLNFVAAAGFLRMLLPMRSIYHNIRCPHRENALSAVLRRVGQKRDISLPEIPQNAPDDSDAPA